MNFGNACTRVSRHAARAVLAAACWAASSSCGSTQTAGLFQGDAWHRADVARTAYGVKGAGVKVCVMSDSIDNGQGEPNSKQGSDCEDDHSRQDRCFWIDLVHSRRFDRFGLSIFRLAAADGKEF
jgi:hypothetical protein